MKKKTSVLLWSLALAVLAAELVFVNRPPSATTPTSLPRTDQNLTEEERSGTKESSENKNEPEGESGRTMNVPEEENSRTMSEPEEENSRIKNVPEEKNNGNKNVSEKESGKVHSGPEDESASEVAAAESAREGIFGNQPGETLPDFSITLTDGTEFALSGMKGRIVLINLWATWCAPCVKELPFFDRLQAEHQEDVFVLAVHSNLITDDVNAYLEKFDYKTAFAVDVSGDVYSLVGGSTMLPQTIVLNREGTVTYNQVGSVTYEVLEELLRQAEGL